MVAVCINREDRPERLAQSQKQFDKYGMNVEIFSAIIASPGWKGCRDSHLAVLEKYRDIKFILIFEDDVLFLDDPMLSIARVIGELPPDWDMLYLGISPTQKYKRHSNHLFKVNGGYTTHAILWNNKEHGIVDYVLSHRDQILKIDVFASAVLHKIFGCYVIYPLLCTQRQEQSDTCKRSDASSIKRNYNRFVG